VPVASGTFPGISPRSPSGGSPDHSPDDAVDGEHFPRPGSTLPSGRLSPPSVRAHAALRTNDENDASPAIGSGSRGERLPVGSLPVEPGAAAGILPDGSQVAQDEHRRSVTLSSAQSVSPGGVTVQEPFEQRGSRQSPSLPQSGVSPRSAREGIRPRATRRAEAN